MAQGEVSQPRPRETGDERKKANSNLAIRLLTAAVCAPLIILLLYRGPDWGLFLLVLVATLIGAWELFNMTHPEDRVSQLIGVAMTALVSGLVYWMSGEGRVMTDLPSCGKTNWSDFPSGKVIVYFEVSSFVIVGLSVALMRRSHLTFMLPS